MNEDSKEKQISSSLTARRSYECTSSIFKSSIKSCAEASHLSSIFHVVLLAGTSPHTAAGGGAALLCAAEDDGILVEVACSLHGHGNRSSLLAHVVAAKTEF